MESKGIVYLIGAGPGDPGLLTLRGAELLARANVVIYDYLANEKLLSHAPTAEKIYVGKKAADHTLSQEQINQLLIDKASAGLRVARLKGGDPFVFGRGAEEAQALHQAGIAFEIVPGITAAIGGLAYAGIPITHRDFNSSFTLITGHEKDRDKGQGGEGQGETRMGDGATGRRGETRNSKLETRNSNQIQNPKSKIQNELDWAALAKLPCLAFYMGVGSLEQICERLISHGMDPHMPAATVQWASTSRQRSVAATLANIHQKVVESQISSPAITIIGKVVTLAPILNWFERRPLFGQRIVVTRTRQQASELTEALEELGAEVIEAPTIEVVEPRDWFAVDSALDHARDFDWIVFTSANGVSAVKRRLMRTARDARIFGRANIAAVGTATARAIENELCLRVDACPARFTAEALADELASAGQVSGKKFMLLRAEIGRANLIQRLRDNAAAEVRDIGVYETQPVKSLPSGLPEMITAGEVNWVTFTSSSTANNFINLLGTTAQNLMQSTKIASIGPVTTQTLRQLGIEPTVQAEQASLSSLVSAIADQGSTHGR